MIDRRGFLATAALALVAAPRLAEGGASRSLRVPRVGVLGEVNPIPWIVSTPVVHLECRWADVERAPLAALANQLLARDIDVLVALGAPAARAAAQRTTHVPIVAVADADLAVEAVDNVTWLRVPSEAEMAEQRLRILGRLVPGLKRVAVVFNPDNPAGVLPGPLLARVADVVRVPARSISEVERALCGRTGDSVDGVLIDNDEIFTENASRLAALTLGANLPAAYGARAFAEAGGLVAVYDELGDLIHRTVTVVRRILGGARAETPSPASPADAHLVLNLATARRLGVKVPPTLRARADVVGVR